MIQRIRQISELQATLQRFSRAGNGATTTWFASAELSKKWIERDALLFEPFDDCLLLFRRDRDFYHLYHVAATAKALSAALASLNPAISGAAITADLIGRGEAVEALAERYVERGFAAYKSLIRMNRITQGVSADEFVDREVSFALPADAPAILAFLEQLLDRFAEQIPEAKELAEACVRQNILVLRRGTELGGVLYFENRGETTILRYWFVAKGYREQGIGARLIKTMFRLCHNSRRILLWVISDNASAIAKYQRYGFTNDGLTDQVMIKRGGEWKR